MEIKNILLSLSLNPIEENALFQTIPINPNQSYSIDEIKNIIEIKTFNNACDFNIFIYEGKKYTDRLGHILFDPFEYAELVCLSDFFSFGEQKFLYMFDKEIEIKQPHQLINSYGRI